MNTLQLSPLRRTVNSYRDVRRATLNFETTGGERHSRDDAWSRPRAKVILMASFARRSHRSSRINRVKESVS